MLNYLINIMKRLEIPKEARPLVLNTYFLMDKGDIDLGLCQYEDENVDYSSMLSYWNFLLKRNKIEEHIGDLLFCLLMCEELEKIYERKGLSKELFVHTMKGITYTTYECFLVYKHWGTACAYWFDEFYRLRRFAFSRLQIELSHFGFTYDDEKYHLRPKMKCLNVHIPRTGERLNEEAVSKDIEDSAKFFRPFLPEGPILYKFESWLIYSKTLEFSNPNSNIAKFATRFKIFKEFSTSDPSEMWRLFDDHIDDLSRLKADTSLRKKYLNHLLNKGYIGEGVSFFVKEN